MTITVEEIPAREDLYPGGMKGCSKCKKSKPLDEFAIVSRLRARGIRKSWCRKCEREKTKIYLKNFHERHPDRAKSYQEWFRRRNPHAHRAERLKRVYGLTLEDYDRILQEQGGVCAICRQPETVVDKNGNQKPLAVDHDHATDQVRGILCHACNVGLGKFIDDPQRLRDAAAYLEASL